MNCFLNQLRLPMSPSVCCLYTTHTPNFTKFLAPKAYEQLERDEQIKLFSSIMKDYTCFVIFEDKYKDRQRWEKSRMLLKGDSYNINTTAFQSVFPISEKQHFSKEKTYRGLFLNIPLTSLKEEIRVASSLNFLTVDTVGIKFSKDSEKELNDILHYSADMYKNLNYEKLLKIAKTSKKEKSPMEKLLVELGEIGLSHATADNNVVLLTAPSQNLNIEEGLEKKIQPKNK